MATPKKYFHDHFVLLLLSVNAFLAIAGSIFILLRLSTSHGTVYYTQYRPSLGVNAYQTGNLVNFLALPVFALVVLAVHTALSLRAYKLNRQLAITVLALGILLLILTIIIGNQLLGLR
ncbi:MAG TPA: hypothetical protein VHA37_09490 [Candidatus Saccharimonadales bacterium]|nr:hypothetical protein [Candidatus Saccharimonadales bacterium]